MKSLFNLFREKRLVFREGEVASGVQAEAEASEKYRNTVAQECKNSSSYEALKQNNLSELFKSRAKALARIDKEVKRVVNYKNLDEKGMNDLYRKFENIVDADFQTVFNHNKNDTSSPPWSWSADLKLPAAKIEAMVQEEIFKMNALRGRKEVADEVVKPAVVEKKAEFIRPELAPRYTEKEIVIKESSFKPKDAPAFKRFSPGVNDEKIAAERAETKRREDLKSEPEVKSEGGKSDLEATEKPIGSRAKMVLDRVNNLRDDFKIRFGKDLPLLKNLNAMSVSLEGSLKEFSAGSLDDEGLKNLETELVIAEGLIDAAKKLITGHELGYPKIRADHIRSYKFSKEQYDESIKIANEEINKSLAELNTQFLKDSEVILEKLALIQEARVTFSLFKNYLFDVGSDIKDLKDMRKVFPKNLGEVQERQQTLAILNASVDLAVNELKRKGGDFVPFAARIEAVR